MERCEKKPEAKGYTRINNALLSAKDLKPTEKQILIQYQKHIGQRGFTWASDTVIGRATNLSPRMISEYKRRLRMKGYLFDCRVICWFEVKAFCPREGKEVVTRIQRNRKWYFTSKEAGQIVFDEAREKMVELMKRKLESRGEGEVLGLVSTHFEAPAFLCLESEVATSASALNFVGKASNPRGKPNPNNSRTTRDGNRYTSKKRTLSPFANIIKWVAEARQAEISQWLRSIGVSAEGEEAIFSLDPDLVIPRFEVAREKWLRGEIAQPGGIRRAICSGWFGVDRAP